MPPASRTVDLAQRQIRDYTRRRAWCEWDNFDAWQPLISAALQDPMGATWPPFLLLSLPGIDANEQRVCAERWTAARLAASAASRHAAASRFAPAAPSEPNRRLRIGYLSNDFHQHATTLLLIEALEAHDPTHFELHAYCHGHDDGLALRQRLRQVFCGFHDIGHLTDVQAAAAIHADGIDILVDLKGYTACSRSLLQAMGVPELVTADTQSYTALASNTQQRMQLKAKLARLAPQAALLDVPGYTHHLEALYRAMWARHVAGQPPQALDA